MYTQTVHFISQFTSFHAINKIKIYFKFIVMDHCAYSSIASICVGVFHTLQCGYIFMCICTMIHSNTFTHTSECHNYKICIFFLLLLFLERWTCFFCVGVNEKRWREFLKKSFLWAFVTHLEGKYHHRVLVIKVLQDLW